jgi:hypothetical protein
VVSFLLAFPPISSPHSSSPPFVLHAFIYIYMCVCVCVYTEGQDGRKEQYAEANKRFILGFWCVYIYYVYTYIVQTYQESRTKPLLAWAYCFSARLFSLYVCMVSRDSAVGKATGYGLDDWEVGVRVPVGSIIITSPYRPDRLWVPPNLLYNGYRKLFPGGKAAGAWSWPLTSN